MKCIRSKFPVFAAVAGLLVSPAGSASAASHETAVENSPSITMPSPRTSMGMAYDAARGQVVMFGGEGPQALLNDTWIWDGTDWTQQFPAHSPPARDFMGMAYDAARGQVVMFGGAGTPIYFDDTWTWDGTDWTQQFPAYSPHARDFMSMAYDAARGQVVMFGGFDGNLASSFFRDTWTWDGTDWTKRSPARQPSSRCCMGMAYDAARSQIVSFGGNGGGGSTDDTWTWNGTDWTEQFPAHAPPAGANVGLAYDAVHSDVVGFSELSPSQTWTWDGTDWTQQFPAHLPTDRRDMGVAFDGSDVVMFGGESVGFGGDFGDTWTWNGTDWSIPVAATIMLSPTSGPPGTGVQVQGDGFGGLQTMKIKFTDPIAGASRLAFVRADGSGSFTMSVTIPLNASIGAHDIRVTSAASGQEAEATFTVT